MRALQLTMVILLILTGVIPASAKGDVDKVTLTGSLWYGEVEITKSDVLDSLALGVFSNFEKELEGPTLYSPGFLMMRSYKIEGEFQWLDQLLYFPGENPGEGIVFYVGMVDAAGPHDGKWYQVRPDSEEKLLGWLSEQGILPASTNFETPRSGGSKRHFSPLMVGGVLIVSLALGFVTGRRSEGLFG